MSQRLFMSFDHAAVPWLDEIVESTRALGLVITGRHIPPGRPQELFPDLAQQLQASIASLIVFGKHPTDPSVSEELEWSQDYGKGIVGIRVDPATELPADLYEAGAEVLDWTVQEDRARLQGAIKAAAAGAALMEKAKQSGSGRGAACERPRRDRG